MNVPNKLHSNDYLLTPEKLEIDYHTLSKYFSNIADRLDLKIDGVNKLVPNLGNKYVLHYRSLQLYLSLGVKNEIDKYPYNFKM